MNATRTRQARRDEHVTGHPATTDGAASRSAVKPGLTPNGQRRPVENDEYASFIRRVLRAYTRRVATGDVDALADMTSLATELDHMISQAVTGLRAAGYSWAEIAARLGVTRQAAQQRWRADRSDADRSAFEQPAPPVWRRRDQLRRT